MSTSANPTAAPLERPAGPKPVAPAPGRFQNRKIWLLAVLLIAAGIAAWYMLKPTPQQVAAPMAVRTAVIGTGTLEQTMRITGTTTAGNYANIAAPLLRGPESRNLTLVEMAEPGSMAKRGQVVAQIDTTAAQDHIDDVEADIQAADSDIRKRQAEHAIEAENLRQSIRVAESNLQKARLDLGAAEIRTAIDQELLKLSVEEYEAAHKAALRDYEIKMASHKSDLRLLEIARERHVRHRDRHVHDLQRFTIRTPMDGLVVMLTLRRSGDMAQVQVGDTVYPNQPFMKVVDPSSMRLEAMVNQVESEHLRVGQHLVASFDAFPGVTLKGRIASVGAIAIGGFRENFYIRNIPVNIELLEQDPRIIPDLSAAADVSIKREENALLVPLEAVHQEGGKDLVYVRRAGSGFDPVEVQLGLSNNTHAAVLSGLKAGDVVALERP